MAAYLTPLGEPKCMGCGYCLSGLPARAVCPECGTRYNTDHPVVAPGLRRQLLIGFHASRCLAAPMAFTWRTAAIITLIVGNAALVITFAVMGYRRLAGW